MGLFMTKVLDDALHAIVDSTLSAGDLFLKLKATEEEDYNRFITSELPETLAEEFLTPADIDRGLILTGP